MSAGANEQVPATTDFPDIPAGLQVVQMGDGTRIGIDQIGTAAEGSRILDDLDLGIINIEDQLREAGAGRRQSTWAWRRSAELALKYRKLMRPRLQARIAELARAERGTVGRLAHEAVLRKADDRRKAFIAAALELLGHETCTEVWARAQEKQPALFADGNRECRS